jgi:hypothetical protein
MSAGLRAGRRAADLDTVARLALVEIQHRSAPPMFAPRHDRPLADLIAQHRALRQDGAVHFLAALNGQPHIGPRRLPPGRILHRFVFLLGASDGEDLFGEPTP